MGRPCTLALSFWYSERNQLCLSLWETPSDPHVLLNPVAIHNIAEVGEEEAKLFNKELAL